jgi:hypothetical protein
MKNLQINGQLFKTKDYDQFTLIDYNRDIDKNHVKNLELKLQEYNDLHLTPFIVTPDLAIVDGQHRFIAARNLGLDVYYMIDENYDPKKMVMHNTTQKRWGNESFLKYWIADRS